MIKKEIAFNKSIILYATDFFLILHFCKLLNLTYSLLKNLKPHFILKFNFLVQNKQGWFHARSHSAALGQQTGI